MTCPVEYARGNIEDIKGEGSSDLEVFEMVLEDPEGSPDDFAATVLQSLSGYPLTGDDIAEHRASDCACHEETL